MLSVDRLEVADSSSHKNSRDHHRGILYRRLFPRTPLRSVITSFSKNVRTLAERYRRDFAREYSLSERGLEFAKEVRRQLLESMRSLDDNDFVSSKRSREEEEQYNKKSERSRTKNLRKALAKGFISKVARRGSVTSNCFKTFAFETKTLTEVHPSSAKALVDEDGLLPDWIVYHEMVMTSRPFLRHVCRIRMD